MHHISYCNLAVLLVAYITVVATASPYYEAVVVEGRNDSDDYIDNEASFDPDECLLPAMPGPCRAGIPMYYYNAATGKCYKFRWGGCGGNGNRFQSRLTCERKCGGVTSSHRPASPQLENNCVRSPVTLRCSTGCFASRQQNGCYQCNCANDPGVSQSRPAICDLPPQRGHCRALLPRWSYNRSIGKCHEFRFGGCDGNGNNFLTEDDCMERCGGGRRKVVHQPLYSTDRYDDNLQQQVDGSSYLTTNYTDAAASFLKYFFQRFWSGTR